MKELFRPEAVQYKINQENTVEENLYQPSWLAVIIFLLIFLISLYFIL